MPLDLATRLRNETASAQQRAEKAGFLTRLAERTASRAAYRALLLDLAAIYGALETELETRAEHPVVAKLQFPELWRSEGLAADCKAFEVDPTAPPSEPAARYIARIREAAEGDPSLLAGHFYARHASGLVTTQILKRAIESVFAGGTADFYDYGDVNISVMRNTLRMRFNELPLTPAQAGDVVKEAILSFELGAAVFEAPEKATPPPPPAPPAPPAAG
ncbi:MAG: biliverdin-producing heme oxygenase [Acidobacteria bacterium]|nr:biliverdin-producing heme oxygenase [Acidobacteriota bacterium]